MRLYVDGVQVATNATINPLNNNLAFVYNGYWRIGWDEMANWPGASANSHFAGGVSEVQIWNIVLSSEFIGANFECPLSGTEPGLLSYFRLDEGGGPFMADSAPAGGSNVGLVFGDPAWTTEPDLPLCFSQIVTELEPATLYHFRATGVNAVTSSYSADKTFTTLSPKLSAGKHGGMIRLFWQWPATGFLLEQTQSAGSPPLTWILVPPPYTTNATTIETEIPFSGQTMFFRLHRP
jgi:hypothetical protein